MCENIVPSEVCSESSINNPTAEDDESIASASPKKGPTVSTSTGSFEPLDPHDPHLSKLATTFFEKTSEYILGELKSTQDDYQLLLDMNAITITKYKDMKQIACKVSTQTDELNAKYKNLDPHFKNVLKLKEKVLELEDIAYKMDSYSKQLESRFKTVCDRFNAVIQK